MRPDRRKPLTDALDTLARLQARIAGKAERLQARVALFARKVLAAQKALGKAAPHPLVDMRPQRLHQVGGQRFAPALGDVQKPEQRVEADDLRLAHDLVVQQGVAERQAHIDRVGRRPPAAPGKLQRSREGGGVRAEIGGGTGTFEPDQGAAVAWARPDAGCSTRL
jgi:hypothetical protein